MTNYTNWEVEYWFRINFETAALYLDYIVFCMICFILVCTTAANGTVYTQPIACSNRAVPVIFMTCLPSGKAAV